MIDVKYMEGEFQVKGTFDWGLAGVCENEEYRWSEEEGITIQNELELLKGAENYEEFYWLKPLKNAFDGKIENLDGEAAAAILTEYYNDLEKQAKEIREQLNNYFLYRLLESMTDTAYPFWETDGAVLDGLEEIDDDVYTEELDEALTEVGNLLCKITDENQPETMKDFNVDMKAMFAKYLPMFNLEGLLETITCEYTYFEGACVSVQFSDDWDCEYYCGAYEKFEPGFIPTDWHNF